jgi:hypothetical protein
MTLVTRFEIPIFKYEGKAVEELSIISSNTVTCCCASVPRLFVMTLSIRMERKAGWMFDNDCDHEG